MTDRTVGVRKTSGLALRRRGGPRLAPEDEDALIGSRAGYRYASRDRRGLADRAGEAHRRSRADGARRRPCRELAQERAGRCAREVAGDRHPGQSGAWLWRPQKSRDRRLRRASSSSASKPSSGAISTSSGRPLSRLDAALDDDIGDDLLRLVFTAPSGALDRSAGRAHAAPARRPDHRGDRTGVPGVGADRRPVNRARQADAHRGGRPLRGPARA